MTSKAVFRRRVQWLARSSLPPADNPQMPLHLTALHVQDPATAALMHQLLQRAHAQEALLLGAGAAPLSVGIADIQASGDFFLGVVDEAGALLGALALGPDESAPSQRIAITTLVVDPLQQRRGIARGLVQEALQRASGLAVSVTTTAANAPALALYRSMGFERIAEGVMGPQALAVVQLLRPADGPAV
jgi:ribosomal protein S18 acetylase RimI-like enzyme